MKCPECGQPIDNKEIGINNLMLPDIWMLEAATSEDKEFTLPISGLTARIEEGKIVLLGDGITLLVKT